MSGCISEIFTVHLWLNIILVPNLGDNLHWTPRGCLNCIRALNSACIYHRSAGVVSRKLPLCLGVLIKPGALTSTTRQSFLNIYSGNATAKQTMQLSWSNKLGLPILNNNQNTFFFVACRFLIQPPHLLDSKVITLSRSENIYLFNLFYTNKKAKTFSYVNFNDKIKHGMMEEIIRKMFF